ncbi:DNA translocase FtsK 4TM domain-containing protein [Candidatus Endomicrobiellum devescovinae]|uniref:FtsK/SpoIIIE family DNA translocase n=1 Tax=Candidatus Endomicrobiellum devescovinae TaxID=3242322 RepID=UPI0028344E26|nr:DNA translocase FtsK 4TM domain-containing protein [Endomicrobium sp.]
MGKNRAIKNKNKNRDNEKINREAVALFFALAVLLSAYAFVVPYKSGIIGRAFYSVTFSIFGTSAYILPFIFLWQFILHIRQSSELKGRLDFIWSFLCMICASVFFEAVHFMFKANISGGWLGDNLYPFLKELLDAWLGLALIAVLTFILFAKILRVSVIRFFRSFFVNLKDDIKKSKTKIEDSNKSGEPFIQQSFAEDVFTRETEPNIVNRFDEEEKKRKEPSKETQEKQESIDSKTFNYTLPPMTLLKEDDTSNFAANKNELLKRAEYLKTILTDFDINAEVKDIIPGPVVTRYDLVLAPGIRIQTVSNIIDNISLAMRTASIRIVPIPEKAVVGIEVPNPVSVIVGLKGILESVSFEKSKSLLTLALGKTTDGAGYVANLASMPHLLIAGATGSGKSVGIHTIILSILYKARPDEVKFMLIDPKRVEMPIYRDIPHLYNPCTTAANADIITNPREAAAALKKLVLVMEERYTKFANVMVRNIEDYNNKMAETGGEKEFYIVVVIDELADLMLVVQKEIEDSIQRLAQMARAVGIHLILATQRPSVNVITGIIKANFPARLSFQTTSKVDSRVILDMLGAESLMGKGDMLFLPPGEARPVRLQGAFVSLKEAEKIISFISNQNFPRLYEAVSVEVEGKGNFDADKESKDLIPALKLISERRRISQDLLKANFGGSARATNILSILEIEGFISKPEGTNKWQINFDKISKYLEANNI